MKVPVYTTIKRFYRTWVDIPDGATEKDIRGKAWNMILEDQDDVLEQIDLDIEEDDIIRIDVDLDDAIDD